MKFAQFLTYIVDKYAPSKKDLADKIGVSKGYIINLTNGHEPPPTSDRCEQIATVLKINEVEKKKLFQLAYEERLDDDDLIFQQALAEVSKHPIKTENITIPVVSWARGGDDAIDVEPVTDFAGKNVEFKNCQAIEVIGDSLAPIAYNGHKIIYSETKIINDGDLVYIGLKDGSKYVKRYYKDNRNNIVILQAINVANHHGPKNVREKDIDFVYKVNGISYD